MVDALSCAKCFSSTCGAMCSWLADGTHIGPPMSAGNAPAGDTAGRLVHIGYTPSRCLPYEGTVGSLKKGPYRSC